eukprot:jgi/Chlat1/5549/Chrsp369S05347
MAVSTMPMSPLLVAALLLALYLATATADAGGDVGVSVGVGADGVIPGNWNRTVRYSWWRGARDSHSTGGSSTRSSISRASVSGSVSNITSRSALNTVAVNSSQGVGSDGANNNTNAKYPPPPPLFCYGGHVLPNLYLIGAQKAGSTSFWGHLVNPEVGAGAFWAYPKEQKMLGPVAARFGPGVFLEKYKQRFPRCRGQQEGVAVGERGQDGKVEGGEDDEVIGEGIKYVLDGTPVLHYIHRGNTPSQIYRLYKDTDYVRSLKFFVLLRDPVTRVLSWFNHIGRRCRERVHNGVTVCTGIPCNQTFDDFALNDLRGRRECLENSWPDLRRAVRRCGATTPLLASWYAAQLGHWFEYFRPSQFHFMDFDEFTQHPEAVLRKAFQFLGLPTEFIPPKVPEQRLNTKEDHMYCPNTVHVSDVREGTLATLGTFFRPYNVQLRALLAASGHADSVPEFARRDWEWSLQHGLVEEER